MNLCEAFRALNALNEDTFSVDADGINKLSAFEQSDDLTDEISIIDPDAETEEELSDSYVGKVILDCCVCHSKLYKSKDEVTLNDEGLLANVGEECPYCYTPDGFKVIGEVAPFDNANTDSDGDGTEEEPIEELFDANVNLDAKGFGGKDNKVSVLGGKMPMGESLDDNKSGKNNDLTPTAVRPSANMNPDDDIRFVKDKTQPIKEDSAVATRPSIASVLSKNMDSLYSYDNPSDLRNAIMDVVSTSDVDPKEVSKLQRALFSKKSVSALLSTIGTYMTGERVVDTTGRNAEMNNSVNESVNNITIETDEDTVDVALDGNGGVNVTAEPTASATPTGEGETIVPVSDETMNELEGNGEAVEGPAEGDEMDVNLDEFDEESFDELGESYFKRIYENVNGYKTTSIKESNNQLIVEGTLKFNSGNLKKTSFVFEALDIDKNGRARFVGDNKQITEGKKAFTLVGKVNGNKFITESMNYNYRDKGADGKTTRVYGNARVSKRG